jgi:peptidyl-prolyl cis-trans isomerase D
MIRGLEDSREVARWAYGAKEGDVSEIFTVGNDYVIAILTEIDDEEYTNINKVAASIRQQLLRDKKYDYITSQMTGATLEEIAEGFGSEVSDFSDVTYGAYYMAGPGLEPRLIGAISTAEKDAVSAPVKGMSGVYVFQVTEVKDAATQTAEAEQVRAQAVQESMTAQYALQAVQQMAEIEDLRGKYF